MLFSIGATIFWYFLPNSVVNPFYFLYLLISDLCFCNQHTFSIASSSGESTTPNIHSLDCFTKSSSATFFFSGIIIHAKIITLGLVYPSLVLILYIFEAQLVNNACRYHIFEYFTHLSLTTPLLY